MNGLMIIENQPNIKPWLTEKKKKVKRKSNGFTQKEEREASLFTFYQCNVWSETVE